MRVGHCDTVHDTMKWTHQLSFLAAMGLFSATALDARAQGQPPATGVKADDLMAHIKILSADEFEGRAPGTAGEEKSIEYLTAKFKELGLAPGNPDGTYIQKVPLAGITAKPTISVDILNGRVVRWNFRRTRWYGRSVMCRRSR
jgi:hypothetical protein